LLAAANHVDHAAAFFGGLALAMLADRGIASTPRLLGIWFVVGAKPGAA